MKPQTEAFLAAADEALSDGNTILKVNVPRQAARLANFGEVEWLPDASIDPVVKALLPTAPRPLTPKDVSAAEKWFGRNGIHPAVHLASGELRGL